MRSFSRFATILLSAVFCRVAAAESPREFVERFCKAEESWSFRGLPRKHHEPLYDSFLGIELIHSIRNANSRLQNLADPTGREMIPHLESNLFTGFSEGPTTWRIGRTRKTSQGVRVAVHRQYRENDAVYQWVDHVILDQDRNGWVVRDIDSHYFGSLLVTIHEFENSLQTGDGTAPRNESYQISK